MVAAFNLQVVAPVRGYHVYKTQWEPDVGDKITFECENGNPHDNYSVAAYKVENELVLNQEIVGHIPREISRWSAFFLEHGGSIEGVVTGVRRYSREAGGMEIPCELTFTGEKRTLPNYEG